jgi:hypothetical protein
VQSLVTAELCSEVTSKQCKLSQDIIEGKHIMF